MSKPGDIVERLHSLRDQVCIAYNASDMRVAMIARATLIDVGDAMLKAMATIEADKAAIAKLRAELLAAREAFSIEGSFDDCVDRIDALLAKHGDKPCA